MNFEARSIERGIDGLVAGDSLVAGGTLAPGASYVTSVDLWGVFHLWPLFLGRKGSEGRSSGCGAGFRTKEDGGVGMMVLFGRAVSLKLEGVFNIKCVGS